MVLPPKNPDIAFEEFVQELPADYEQTAYEFKAFCRPRKVKSPAQLMRVLMSYCGIDRVLRESAGNFTLPRERIGDTAINNRLRACLPRVKALLQKMRPGTGKAAGLLRFVVADGSTVQAPGSTGTDYRLHVTADLLTLEILSIEVTDCKKGERSDRCPLKEGDVITADRGYNRPARIIELSKQGILVLIRLNPWSMPLRQRAEGDSGLNGVPLDLYDILKRTKANKMCLPVWLGTPGNAGEGWVHVQRLPAHKVKEARRKCRRNAKKTPGKETLLFAEWRMIFTTVPEEIADTDTVMNLYELRWQVELLIKRLKSLLNIDKLRAKKGSALGDIWLHGKLLYALIIEKRVRRQFRELGTRLNQERSATLWRFWKTTRHELSTLIAAPACWKAENRNACMKVMAERPRKRKLQTMGDSICRLIEACKKLGVFDGSLLKLAHMRKAAPSRQRQLARLLLEFPVRKNRRFVFSRDKRFKGVHSQNMI